MKRADKRREFSQFVFHSKGARVGDWRKRWKAACVAAGLARWIMEGDEIVGYEGPIFHDLRRSGIRDMVRAGVPQSVVMAISGHRTISTFLRYDIASEEDKRAALERAAAHRAGRQAK
jgi:integrase